MMKKNRKKFQLNYDEMEDGGRVSMENDEIKQTRQKKKSYHRAHISKWMDPMASLTNWNIAFQ